MTPPSGSIIYSDLPGLYRSLRGGGLGPLRVIWGADSPPAIKFRLGPSQGREIRVAFTVRDLPHSIERENPPRAIYNTLWTPFTGPPAL